MTAAAYLFALALTADGGAAGPLVHATWLSSDWLEGKRTDAEAAAKVRWLCERRVRVLFPRVGSFGEDGRLPARGTSAKGRSFVAAARKACSGAEVMPWVSGVVGRQVRLEDERWRSRASAAIAAMVKNLGATGVHLDVEPPIERRDRRIPGSALALLLEAMARDHPGLKRSVALPPLRSEAFPWGLETSDAVAIAASTEQVVPMLYDTGIADAEAYVGLVADQARQWSAIAGAKGSLEVLLGAPSYERQPSRKLAPLHDPAAENLPAAVCGLARALGHGAVVRGIAVYAEWTTDDKEWESLVELGGR